MDFLMRIREDIKKKAKKEKKNIGKVDDFSESFQSFYFCANNRQNWIKIHASLKWYSPISTRQSSVRLLCDISKTLFIIYRQKEWTKYEIIQKLVNVAWTIKFLPIQFFLAKLDSRLNVCVKFSLSLCTKQKSIVFVNFILSSHNSA